MMNEHGKSDSNIVPTKSSNKTGQSVAERVEGRTLAKGKSAKQNTHRIQCRESVQNALERVRQAAKGDRKQKFTALLHHIYNINTLKEAYFGLKRDAAAGVDGETWRGYGESLCENLEDLSGRLKRGGYRAKPVRRQFIPKADGRQRPLGVPVLEDKIVQRATVMVLNCIYENDFLGFSYGYRPGRNQHNALDALYTGILTTRVGFIIDADIRGFFETIDHEWMIKFIEHRIADKRIIRLIRKWLKAGVLEEGKWRCSEEGTPQGGAISPLLSNLYLHYVFDLWVQHWRRSKTKGDMIIVRWADDFIVGFQWKTDAERFLRELRERFKKFKLELHPEKTRLIEFGYYAAHNRRRRGEGRPETFDFLGFTHSCGKKRSNGMFTVNRRTIKKRYRAKLKEVKTELRRRMHLAVPQVGKWLRSVVGGHIRYYGVPSNDRGIYSFRFQVAWLWYRSLRRRSQMSRLTWERMYRYINHWLPAAKVCHPYPLRRMGVSTQGRSRMR